jgi:hypothetical protein
MPSNMIVLMHVATGALAGAAGSLRLSAWQTYAAANGWYAAGLELGRQMRAAAYDASRYGWAILDVGSPTNTQMGVAVFENGEAGEPCAGSVEDAHFTEGWKPFANTLEGSHVVVRVVPGARVTFQTVTARGATQVTISMPKTAPADSSVGPARSSRHSRRPRYARPQLRLRRNQVLGAFAIFAART